MLLCKSKRMKYFGTYTICVQVLSYRFPLDYNSSRLQYLQIFKQLLGLILHEVVHISRNIWNRIYLANYLFLAQTVFMRHIN